MHVNLKPVSHPDLGEIVINDSLFSIGRYEPPFSGYPPEKVSRLSRRHARIFEQDGNVYIVDLGSLNGTTVNGKPLPQHHLQLQQNDEICFAGQLTYNTEVLERETVSAKSEAEQPKVILTLTPQIPNSSIEPIVISEFPFLISKSNDVFSRYAEVCPDELTYISRRHAHIFSRQGNLFIEDLGSTNGTFVAEGRLDEQARILRDGDSIAFGGNYFIYTVKISHIAANPGQPYSDATTLVEGLSNTLDNTRTTFVTSANSFLDIFCMESEEQEQQESAIAENRSTKKNEPHKSTGSGRLARFSTFMHELRGAFGEKQPRGRRHKGWIVTATVTIALAISIGYFYVQDTPKREIVRLLSVGNYERSLKIADNYLVDHPDDKEVPEHAAKALARYIVPAWTESLSQNEFNMAHAALEQARQMSQHNSSGLAIIDLLEWITQLEALVHERGGVNAPIAIFEHEERIDALLSWWESDIEGHRRMAGQIARYEPTFSDTRAMAFSHLRTLNNEKSTYLAALARFKQILEERLEADSVEGLISEISDFHAKYPRISGIDKLEQDLQNYLLVHEQIKTNRWLDAVKKIDELEFLTPPFIKKIETLQAKQLPPKDVIQQFQRASDLWRNGQPAEAIATLESLNNGPWEKSATSELVHKKTVFNQYAALAQRKQRDSYPQQLVAFYVSLDPVEDSYFVTAIKNEFQVHRKKILLDANRSLSIAHTAWNNYQETGGIRGLQRLERKISKKFRNQANHLSDAYKQAHRSAEIYQLLKIDNAGAQSLYQAILKECRLQRRSLQQLGMVLEPSLLEAKLKLLPEPDSKSKPDPEFSYNLVLKKTYSNT